MAVVLIVIDEADTMLMLHRDLESAGHDVVLTADAEAALARLAVLPVDVVMVDVATPVHDGWTVLEALRDRSPRTPAIVVSGRAHPDDLERARRLGAVGSLALPATPEELDRAVTLALAAAATA